ncbi:holo-[acyl-carrier-protein] synthase [Alphaproteobacteria bacterium]|nr:holo-[acyl-carrier-protein] synthase [Alphaproteobacteria bacterium]
MILGIGTDILDIRRIEKALFKFGSRFEKKIYTERELNFARKRKLFVETLAKMFSMKESVIKAISDVSGVFWRDIEILHDENGKPEVLLHGVALENMKRKSKDGEFHINASASDEMPYVCSFVVIEAL